MDVWCKRRRIEEGHDRADVLGERLPWAVRLDDEERRKLFRAEQPEGYDAEPETPPDERDAAPERGRGGIGEALLERHRLVGDARGVAAPRDQRGPSRCAEVVVQRSA